LLYTLSLHDALPIFIKSKPAFAGLIPGANHRQKCLSVAINIQVSVAKTVLSRYSNIPRPSRCKLNLVLSSLYLAHKGGLDELRLYYYQCRFGRECTRSAFN